MRRYFRSGPPRYFTEGSSREGCKRRRRPRDRRWSAIVAAARFRACLTNLAEFTHDVKLATPLPLRTLRRQNRMLSAVTGPCKIAFSPL